MSTPMRDERLARAMRPVEEALRLHALCRGKMQTLPKCPVRGFEDFALWYTPGVAAPSRAIAADPDAVWVHTSKADTIAIVTDGTRVLGLGDIGPAAALPVMEGKALLFKYLGGVDAVSLCLATRDADELVHTVSLLEPAFGGVNLEDIAPAQVLPSAGGPARTDSIPVWHDDQQGTATAVVAGAGRPRGQHPPPDGRVGSASPGGGRHRDGGAGAGLAGLSRTAEDVASHARRLMQRARDATTALMEAGLIASA